MVIPIFIFTPEQIENEKNSFKSSNAVQVLVRTSTISNGLLGSVKAFSCDPLTVVAWESLEVRTVKKFMIESLKDLDERMENKLNLMYGNYIDVIEHMKEKHGINGVYANTDYSPYAKVQLPFCIPGTVTAPSLAVKNDFFRNAIKT